MSSVPVSAPALFSTKQGESFRHPLLDIFLSPDLRRVLPGLALAAFLYNLIALALPMAILQIIDRVLTNQSVETLVFLVCGVLLGLLMEEFLRAINALVTGWLGARFEHAASIATLDRLMRVPRRHLKREEPGVHAERVAAASRVAEFYSGQALLVVFDLPFVLLFLIMIYVIGNWVVVVPVAMLLIITLVTWQFGNWIRKQVELRHIHEDRRFNFLQEVFSGIHSVKTLSMEAQMERRHDRLQGRSSQVNETFSYVSAMATSTGMLFSQLMIVCVVYAGALSVLSGEMTPGGLTACMMLSVRALQPLRRSFSIWLRYQSFLTAHARLAEVARMPWVDDADKSVLAPIKESIELRQITIARSEGSPLFWELNLNVRAGECVAIRGDTGSGKTALLSVMNGTERPDSGTVLVDGRDLADFSADSVQRQIAMISQTGTIFSGTVLENLTMFNPVMKSRALEIAREMGLDAIVATMQLGYQTPLGEGNIEILPSGVRQLISIVRALVQGPSVVLFDEANTSLDMEGDRRMREYFIRRKGDWALILVTHRPSLLSLADRTLVISSGVLSESAESSDVASAGADTKASSKLEYEKPIDVENLSEMVRQHFLEETDIARCLVPMLQALGWQGSARELAEALPQMIHSLDLTGFCSVMANLEFHPHQITGRLDRLDSRLTPCLFVPAAEPAVVITKRLPNGQLSCFDTNAACEIVVTPDSVVGEIFLFKPRDPIVQGAGAVGGFFRSLIHRFRPHIALILFLTVCNTFLALVPPLFVKTIYDHVLPNSDFTMQMYLFLGVTILLALDFQLRKLKSRVMSFVAGRAEFIVGTTIFNRVLSLPASATENVSVNRQVGRMRSFDSLREFFLGPLSVLAFDLPASLVLIAAIGVINPLALIVVLMGGGAFVLLALASRGSAERKVTQTGRAMGSRREFLDEAIGQMSAICNCGSRAIWLERFRQMCGTAVSANYRDQQYQARINGAAQLLGTATGLIALAVSAYAAINGSISGGAMIATMMIVWRLTGPMQNFFLATASLVKIRSSVLQIENLMRLPSESVGRTKVSDRPPSEGSFSFTRVSFRYTNDADPALLGISLNVTPRQIVVVTGPNGSGKSTLLKLMTRAFTPQAGTIRFDGLDIRQLTAADLRSRISYMPQNCDLFYGTVSQNLRLTHPAATPQEIAWAADMAGLTEEVRVLPKGLETRISNNQSEQLPIGFRQRLALARTLLKPAALVILDEPGTGMDKAGEAALQRCIEWLRRRATLMIVSHRPGHMRLADVVLYMEHGSIAAAGPFDKVKARIMAGLN